MDFTLLDLKKEYAQKRGELQNGSITGMNTDAQSLMLKDLNREMQELADLQPPFLNTKKKIYTVAATSLVNTTSVNTATGTAKVPRLIDSSKNLKKKDVFCMVTDGTYHYRVIGVTGTTYDLDSPLIEAATTATEWLGYHDTYPLAHNMGDVTGVYYEDGETPLSLTNSRQEFDEFSRRDERGSYGPIGGINVFTNEWDWYKYRETSVTVTNSSRVVTVATTETTLVGDVINLVQGTTTSLHTVAGVSGVTLYLDRDFLGSSGGATIEINPRQHTEWLSIYRYPTTERQIVVTGWERPQDMVFNTDVCPFPALLCPLIVIGALLRNKLGMEVLTEQWVSYYQMWKKRLRKKKKSGWTGINIPDNWTGVWGDDYSFEDYTYA